MPALFILQILNADILFTIVSLGGSVAWSLVPVVTSLTCVTVNRVLSTTLSLSRSSTSTLFTKADSIDMSRSVQEMGESGKSLTV